MRNPKVKPFKVLGFTQGQWTALLGVVDAHLTANDDKSDVDEATVRALDPALGNDRVWNQVKAELGV